MFRKPFADRSYKSFFILGGQPTSLDAALHSVQQLQPILKRGGFQWLPLIKAAFADMEPIVSACVLDIHLQFCAFRRSPLPTDLCFRHETLGDYSGRSTAAIAIAAIPSFRPTKPICSFVVALIPILRSGTPIASAMCCFMVAI